MPSNDDNSRLLCHCRDVKAMLRFSVLDAKIKPMRIQRPVSGVSKSYTRSIEESSVLPAVVPHLFRW